MGQSSSWRLLRNPRNKRGKRVVPPPHRLTLSLISSQCDKKVSDTVMKPWEQTIIMKSKSFVIISVVYFKTIKQRDTTAKFIFCIWGL